MHIFMNNYFQMLYLRWNSDHWSALLPWGNGETLSWEWLMGFFGIQVLFFYGFCWFLISGLSQMLVGLFSHWRFKFPWSGVYLLIVFLRMFASSQLPQKNSGYIAGWECLLSLFIARVCSEHCCNHFPLCPLCAKWRRFYFVRLAEEQN